MDIALRHNRFRPELEMEARKLNADVKEAGDPSIKLHEVKLALDDINSESPQKAEQNLALIKRATQNADLSVLRNSDVQKGIAKYIKTKSLGESPDINGLKELFFNEDANPRFSTVLNESVIRYGKDKEFLNGLKRFIGLDDDARVQAVGNDLYAGLTRSNTDGTTVLDAYSPTMTKIESSSHNPLVSALATFARAAGLSEAIVNTKAKLKDVNAKHGFDGAITKNEAEAYTKNNLGHILDSSSHELLLGDKYGRYSPQSISASDKRDRLGIKTGMKDPFRGRFDPYDMVVDALMADKDEKVEIFQKGFAYLYKLEAIAKEKAAEMDKASPNGPSRANRIDKQFKTIRNKLITGLAGDPLLSSAIAAAFDGSPITKESLEMVTAGVLDEKRTEATSFLLNDISLQAKHRNPNLRGLVGNNGDGKFTVTEVNTKSFNEDSVLVDRLYAEDSGEGSSLEETVSNLREAHEATTKAIGDAIHDELGEQNTTFTQDDIKEYKEALKNDRTNVGNSYNGQINHFAAKLDQAFSNTAGKNITKFSGVNTADEIGSTVDEIIEKLMPKSDSSKILEKHDVQGAISDLKQAIDVNSGVGAATKALFRAITLADTHKGRKGTLTSPDAKRQDSITASLKRHSDGIITRTFLADKPKVDDLTSNLSSEAIKNLTDGDSTEAKDLKNVIKRVDSVSRADFKDVFAHPEQGKSAALQMLFYKDSFSGEAAPNTNLTGLALLFDEITSEDTKKFIVTELMIDKSDKRFQADNQAEKEELIEARAQEIVNAIENVRAKHDIKIQSNEDNSIVDNFNALNDISKDANAFSREMDSERARTSKAIVNGSASIGDYTSASYLRDDGSALSAATTAALTAVLPDLELISHMAGVDLIAPTGGLGGALTRIGFTEAKLNDAINELEKEANLHQLDSRTVDLLQSLKTAKTAVEETANKASGTGLNLANKVKQDVNDIFTYLNTKSRPELERMGIDLSLVTEFAAVHTSAAASPSLDATATTATVTTWLNSSTTAAGGKTVKDSLNTLRSKIKRHDSAEGATKSFDDWSELAVKYFHWYDESQYAFNDGITMVRNAVNENVSGFVNFTTIDSNLESAKGIVKEVESLIKPYTEGSGMAEIGMEDPVKFLIKKAGGNQKLKDFIKTLFDGAMTYLPKSTSETTSMLATQRKLSFVQGLLLDLGDSINEPSGESAPKANNSSGVTRAADEETNPQGSEASSKQLVS